MGEVLAVDFKRKKSLGKVPERTEQEELTRLAKEVMGLVTEQPMYESSLGFISPEKDPA